MATPTQAQARSHYARQSRIAALAAAACRSLFKSRKTGAIPATVARYQYAAAKTSVETIARWAGDTTPVTQPLAFAGRTSEGYPLNAAIRTLLDDLTRQFEAEAEVEMHRLVRAIKAQVADAGRTASQVEIVARPNWTNYVRMTVGSSCPRCAILAGRIYRDLEAFARHPACDCVMIPVADWQEAHDKGLASSFAQAFAAGNVHGLSKADEQAIRDGADPAQVVNASRGVTVPGRATAAVVVDGLKATTTGAPRGMVRLRPEAIYKIARNRAEVQQLLMRHGYIGDVNPDALIEAPDVAQEPFRRQAVRGQNRPYEDIAAAIDAAVRRN